MKIRFRVASSHLFNKKNSMKSNNHKKKVDDGDPKIAYLRVENPTSFPSLGTTIGIYGINMKGKEIWQPSLGLGVTPNDSFKSPKQHRNKISFLKDYKKQRLVIFDYTHKIKGVKEEEGVYDHTDEKEEGSENSPFDLEMFEFVINAKYPVNVNVIHDNDDDDDNDSIKHTAVTFNPEFIFFISTESIDHHAEKLGYKKKSIEKMKSKLTVNTIIKDNDELGSIVIEIVEQLMTTTKT